MKPEARTRPTRKPYRVVVSLFPKQWEQLEDEAKLRGISGGELIESVLSNYIAYRSDHAPVPPPDDSPEDA